MLGLTDAEIQSALQMLIKLGVGTLLGGLIGLEREYRDHPAGIRTHILLVVGVILFTEVSKGFGVGDPGRVAAQVVTGVGFLCAGAIIRTGVDVKGLTTSASLFAAAGIGMAVSIGGAYMAVAVVATLLCLFTLSLVAKFEKRFFPQSQTHTLALTLDHSSALVNVLEQVYMKPSATVKGVVVHGKEPEVRVEIKVQGESKEIVAELLHLEGVRIAAIQ